MDYPLATRFGAGALLETPITSRVDRNRVVSVFQTDKREEVLEHIRSQLEAGRCVCWIRNTVTDALEAFDWIQQELKLEDRCLLFHARFAMGDRLDREGEVLRRFGPESGRVSRAGRLLIATQVVEQSLDLDFDAMVSDLAPIDLLIQRMGRLRRHPRAADGALCKGGDRRGPIEMLIYGPAPVEEPASDWYSALFPHASAVYPNHAQLWSTARVLRQKGQVIVPGGARELIEAVYGAEAAVPEGLRHRASEAEGRAMSEGALAIQNRLELSAGYTHTMHWTPDVVTPTRLGEPAVRVRLVRCEGAKLSPWYDDDAHPWELSELSIRQALIKDEVGAPEVLERLRTRMPDRGRFCKVVLLRPAGDVWEGEALDGRERPVQVRYTTARGLEVVTG